MISLKKFFITYISFFIVIFLFSIFFVNNLIDKSKLNEKNKNSIEMSISEEIPIIEVYSKYDHIIHKFRHALISKVDRTFDVINQKLTIKSEKNLISDNLIKKYSNEIKLFDENIKNCFIKAYNCSDEKLKKIYLIEIFNANNFINLSPTQFSKYLNCLFTQTNLNNDFFCDEDYKKNFYNNYIKLNLEVSFIDVSEQKYKQKISDDDIDTKYKTFIIIFVFVILISIIILSMPLTIFLTKHRLK